MKQDKTGKSKVSPLRKHIININSLNYTNIKLLLFCITNEYLKFRRQK